MTYSLLGRDPETGEMGVASQSQAFAVGASVTWAQPGHGVVATQSMGEPMYGQLGLEVLREGLTAEEALRALRSVDPHPERRQVAMVDTDGGLAVYTGEACVAAAGHAVGEQCVALANMMVTEGVWDRMAAAFADAAGLPLAQRLLAGLDAAEDAGGDLRGRRSAVMTVVCATPSGRPWQDLRVDLRVDDHAEPVVELRRLVDYAARYHQAVEAFELALDGEVDRALARLPSGVDPAQEPELALWEAVVCGEAGDHDRGRVLMDELSRAAPDLVETARRFGDAGLVPPETLRRLLGGDAP